MRSTSPVEMYRGRVDNCHCGTVGTAAISAAATRPSDTRNLRYMRIDVVSSRTWLRVRCSMCSNSARRNQSGIVGVGIVSKRGQNRRNQRRCTGVWSRR